MVKKIGMVLLCTMFGSSLYAEQIVDNQKFIGVEVSITEVQGEQPGDTSRGQSYGLRVGAQNEKWRTMFTLNYFDSGEHNVEKLFLSVDYFFMKTDVYDSYALQPYLGLNLGYMNFESIGINANGFVYGMQGGMVLDMTEKIGLDLGYRYSLSSANELDHTGDVVFGINYQY
ncbi:MAG TPA: hypothetical protein ENK98_09995 [Epsilonproteobacteria bacterium]|nr:hypothetical protein [Campylobacterota bacterium]